MRSRLHRYNTVAPHFIPDISPVHGKRVLPISCHIDTYEYGNKNGSDGVMLGKVADYEASRQPPQEAA